MKMKLTLYVLLLAALFTGCSITSARPDQAGSQDNKGLSGAFSGSSGHVPGSRNYVKYINKYAEASGNKSALKMVAGDVEKNCSLIGKNPANDLRLYKLISMLVYRTGYVDIEVHYLRNKLNNAPKSFEELRKANSSLPTSGQWRLVSVRSSFYHMQGDEGMYNMKFISANGFCEAVYNKYGILLTEENDPVNMGTFNYGAGIPEAGSHQRFDIDPYLEWGNSAESPQKGRTVISIGVSLAKDIYNQNKDKINEYRRLMMEGGIGEYLVLSCLQLPERHEGLLPSYFQSLHSNAMPE